METKVTQRNYGIDLLRLVAAIYVVIPHVLNQGGLYTATVPDSAQNYACRILLIFTYCTVSIFGMISGFVGYKEPGRRFSISGYLSLWIDVVFYSIGLTLIYMYLRPDVVTTETLFNMFFPVTKNLYWYFSAYTVVYFLSPFLNRIVYHCSEKELHWLFFLIFFIIVPVDYIGADFSLSGGYSSLWLIFMYLLGAIIKKLNLGASIHPGVALLAVILINSCFYFINTVHPEINILNISISFELNYFFTSPFFLASAVLHVIIFSRMRINAFTQKLIAFAAPASFAAYIVNVQECFWLYYMKDHFVHWSDTSPIGIIARTVGFSVLFVLIVILIDYPKRKLFSCLKIDTGLRKISEILQKSHSV